MISIDAAGGNGGNGGNGGCGGNGSDGKKGFDGQTGRQGDNRLAPGVRGGDGEDGTDGDKGGNGGDGGAGGRGGDGGDAGSGGCVEITVEDPALLALIEVDTRCGLPGKKGIGGEGGRGGSGGRGGEGGKGGRGGYGGKAEMKMLQDVYGRMNNTVVTEAGADGRDGKNGKRGSDGVSGNSGSSGTYGVDGAPGVDGKVALVVVDPATKSVVAQAGERFKAQMCAYDVRDEDGDGVFEPGTLAVLSGVTFVNDGGLALPGAGKCMLLAAATRDVTPVGAQGEIVACEALPELPVNQTYISPATFAVRLPAAPSPPTPNTVFSTTVEVHPRVDCLGVPLFESVLPSPPIVVQWPVRTAALHSPDSLSPEECGPVRLDIKNMSVTDLGADAAAHVSVQVRFTAPKYACFADPNAASESSRSTSSSPAYKVECSEDGCALVTVHKLAANSVLSVVLELQLRASAADVVLDSLPWTCTLLLRGSPVEVWTREIRVAPKQMGGGHGMVDAVLVTSAASTPAQLAVWRSVFAALSWSYELFDLHKSGGGGLAAAGLARPSDGWQGRCRYLLFPLARHNHVSAGLLHMDDAVVHLARDSENGILLLDTEAYDSSKDDTIAGGAGLRDTDPILFDFTRAVHASPAFLRAQSTHAEAVKGLLRAPQLFASADVYEAALGSGVEPPRYELPLPALGPAAQTMNDQERHALTHLIPDKVCTPAEAVAWEELRCRLCAPCCSGVACRTGMHTVRSRHALMLHKLPMVGMCTGLCA